MLLSSQEFHEGIITGRYVGQDAHPMRGQTKMCVGAPWHIDCNVLYGLREEDGKAEVYLGSILSRVVVSLGQGIGSCQVQ